MKQTRYKKILGLAVGDSSMMVAEVAAGERLQVRNLNQFTYPDGVTIEKPDDLGKALGEFLKEKGFTAKSAVVGIPVRWLVVKPKDVPAADTETLTNLLRLEAETEFSTELKDLVYDFADDPGNSSEKSVLITATPRRYIDALTSMCLAARIEAVGMVPSSLALAQATGNGRDKQVLVLATGPTGSELTAQDVGTATAVRHLRSPIPAPPFVSEMRRVVSMLGSGASSREMVLWDGAGGDTGALANDLGLKVTVADLPSLGIDTSVVSSNGDGRKFASAVGLAMSAMSDRGLPVDFLHSRLAAPVVRLVPRWAYFAAAVALILLIAGINGEYELHKNHAELDSLKQTITAEQPNVDAANKFLSQESLAEFYHGGNPRYMNIVLGLTLAVPNDGQTYASKITLGDVKVNRGSNQPAAKKIEPQKVVGALVAKTSDDGHVIAIRDALAKTKGFSNVKDINARHDPKPPHEVSFEITFEYFLDPNAK